MDYGVIENGTLRHGILAGRTSDIIASTYHADYRFECVKSAGLQYAHQGILVEGICPIIHRILSRNILFKTQLWGVVNSRLWDAKLLKQMAIKLATIWVPWLILRNKWRVRKSITAPTFGLGV